MGLLELAEQVAAAWVLWVVSLFADVGAVTDYINEVGEAGDA